MASLQNNLAATMAFNRFGLGARPDDVIPANPAAWLIGQLAGPDPYTGAGLPNTAAALAQFAAIRAQNQSGPTQNYQIFQMMQNEVDAQLQNALTTKVPFRERLVWFWANHFAVQGQELETAAVAGPFVREAIRPYVNGTFAQMLNAVIQHPAMLLTLTNETSTGPDSVAGLRCQASGCTTVGFNENLARECLELHTLGINGGYTQADVDSLSMLLTGWTVNIKTSPMGFSFNPSTHEPVAQTLMNNQYAATQSGGLAALNWLATQPATYQHLATQLVTHFVSDSPLPSDIATVAAALSRSGGSLSAAAAAVVGLSNAWVPGNKFRTPIEYSVACMRACGLNAPINGLSGNPRAAASAMGQDVWAPIFPNGYSDQTADWAGPAQMILRGDFVYAFANLNPTIDPTATAADTLGPLLRPTTIAAMAAVPSQHSKLSLLFLSPEFQRR